MAKAVVEITNFSVYPKAHAWSTNELATRAGKLTRKLKHLVTFGHLSCMHVCYTA